MGIAVVGGMILATGLTLYVIPAVYSYLSKEHRAARVEESFEVAAANGVRNGTRG
jgi:multidrug efflux pump